MPVDSVKFLFVLSQLGEDDWVYYLIVQTIGDRNSRDESMRLKQVFFAAGYLVIAAAALTSNTMAATAPACSVSAIVGGGGASSGQGSQISSNTNGIAPHGWTFGFGEGAVDFNCGMWVFQVDGSDYYKAISALNAGTYVQDNSGHFGGTVFWRDPDMAALGVSLSRTFTSLPSSEGTPYPKAIEYGAVWRLGGFGEYFAGDRLTLGAGANYITGKYPSGAENSQAGVEADLYGKLYATENLGFTLRGDVLSSNITYNFGTVQWGGYAVSAQAEYLVPGTALSVFAGARFADRAYRSTGYSANLQDTEGFAGVQFAIGGPTPTSLRERDRHGTYDNTSVFDEKLPSGEAEIGNANIADQGF